MSNNEFDDKKKYFNENTPNNQLIIVRSFQDAIGHKLRIKFGTLNLPHLRNAYEQFFYQILLI